MEFVMTDQRIYADRILVRCTSHRARERLFRLLGYRPQGWVSFTRNVDKGLYEVPPERLADALRIKGIRRTRWSDDLMRPLFG
jgi:hypothetical protein